MRADTELPILDLREKKITTFIAFEVASEIESAGVGVCLEFLTDDHVAIDSDLRAWAVSNGHRIVESESIASGRRFVVEKGTGSDEGRSMALVISTDGLEELLSPLGSALAAALEGMSVDIYFQEPGVRVLERGFRPKLTGWWRRPFSRMAASGMAAAGHIAAQDKLRQLMSLGAQVPACAPSLERFKVSPDDLIFDDVPQIEYLSFMEVMKDADVDIYE